MLALRLPEEIERRLAALAKRSGRSKSFYAREAILEHLDDLEAAYLSDEILKRVESG
ncbi:MAG: type II toxin-antitoxin system RelB family antitoxin, partial [Desulfurivibrionaceae bacterium]